MMSYESGSHLIRQPFGLPPSPEGKALTSFVMSMLLNPKMFVQTFNNTVSGFEIDTFHSSV